MAPAITWPSHTTVNSGVPPYVHGILGNRRPNAEGSDYYWSASLLKSRTLRNVLREKGMKSASIASKATPGFIQEIAAGFPSFSQLWMNDRTRALPAINLLGTKKARAAAAPSGRPRRRSALSRPIQRRGKSRSRIHRRPDRRYFTRCSIARSAEAAEKVWRLGRNPKMGIGREVPVAEFRALAPQSGDAVAVWEPAEHYIFMLSAPHEKGNHGLWPRRPPALETFFGGFDVQTRYSSERELDALIEREGLFVD